MFVRLFFPCLRSLTPWCLYHVCAYVCELYRFVCLTFSKTGRDWGPCKPNSMYEKSTFGEAGLDLLAVGLGLIA